MCPTLQFGLLLCLLQSVVLNKQQNTHRQDYKERKAFLAFLRALRVLSGENLFALTCPI